ncbi:hypothetical protein KCU81_g388, partial [Aureobasidium melanogenum]
MVAGNLADGGRILLLSSPRPVSVNFVQDLTLHKQASELRFIHVGTHLYLRLFCRFDRYKPAIVHLGQKKWPGETNQVILAAQHSIRWGVIGQDLVHHVQHASMLVAVQLAEELLRRLQKNVLSNSFFSKLPLGRCWKRKRPLRAGKSNRCRKTAASVSGACDDDSDDRRSNLVNTILNIEEGANKFQGLFSFHHSLGFLD